MEDLSLHVLDVSENAVAAGAERIDVRIFEEPEKDLLRIEIQDNGRGMDAHEVNQALDPFYTTKPGKRVGLGLPLFAQAAREAGGALEVQSRPGGGTLVRATFRLSHPDLKPMGDMLETLAALICAHPRVHVLFERWKDGVLLMGWNTNRVESTGT